MCWNASTNVWEQTFVNDNSANYPATPKGGDEAAWFWNPRTNEYVTLDMAQWRPQSYAFSMVTRTWRPIGDAQIRDLSRRLMPFGSGTAHSPDHNLTIITHGGQYIPNVTRVIDFNTTPPSYLELRTGLPPARVLIQNMFVYASTLRKFVLFGGLQFGTGRVANDLWTLDPVTWTWTQEQHVNAPPARDNAQMAYDPTQNVIYLTGGLLDNGTSESIVWILDLNRSPYTWTALPLPAGVAGVDYPRARIAGTSIFDANRGFCVVGGSLSGGSWWGESLATWCFKHQIGADTTPPPPPGSNGGSFTQSQLGNISVAWTRSPTDTGNAATTDVLRYELLRSQDNGATWIDGRTVAATGAPTYAFTYSSVLFGMVIVRAVDGANNPSAWVRLF
jgi:hypothetical protein